MLCVLLEDQMHRSVSLWIYSSKHILYSVDKEHHRYQIQQCGGLHGEICFVIQLNLVSERRLPAEGHRHPGKYHRPRSTSEEVKPGRALPPEDVAYWDFYNSWETEYQARWWRPSASHRAAGGVTFLWQCLSRKCNQTQCSARISASIQRQKTERKESKLSIFKPANQSEACLSKWNQLFN